MIGRRALLLLVGLLPACGAPFESDALFLTTDGGAHETSIGGAAGAAGAGGSAGSALDSGGAAGSAGAGGTAGVPSGGSGGGAGAPTCTCEVTSASPSSPCGPVDATPGTCGAVSKNTCLRCTETCVDQPTLPNCKLNVGVGSAASDPTHSWWCCS